MKFKYRLMWFDMPEYNGGNCDTVDVFDDPEAAYAVLERLEKENTNENIWHMVVLDKDS